jgi:muramoyltetrapeptide carboxypeptidase
LPDLGCTWPAPLRAGDGVAVVAPSGPSEAARLEGGAAVIRGWGLDVRLTPGVFGRHDRLPYLAGADERRAEDFAAAWCDPGVAAVWAARGGYGSQRMVDKINFSALRAAGPKHLVGSSDITALHTRVRRELRQVTIHGPGVGSIEQLIDPASAASVRRLLMEASVAGTELCRGLSARAGEAVGVLVGGNLSLLAADVGIEPAPSSSCIVMLEDVGEAAYRVDRLLTQLLRTGWFGHAVGVVIGEFTGAGDPALLERVVAERLAGLQVPMLRGVPVGHGHQNLALPLGAAVRIEVGRSTGVLRLA